MPRALPVDEVKTNILLQFQASEDILHIISQLADIARGNDDQILKKNLEIIMYDLLEVGKQLSKSAEDTGKKFFAATRQTEGSIEHLARYMRQV